MLVLSRKPEQDFRFPSLGVVVRLLSVKGRAARIGIEAPDDISIIRGEVAPTIDNLPVKPNDLTTHEWKNRLNEIKLGLTLAQRNFELGNLDEGQETLVQAIHALSQVEAANSQRNSVESEQLSTERENRILLVEDDPNELRLLAGLLRLEGYDVSTARDGDEAIDHLSNFESIPDYVLLDMRMPHRNGPETVRWIRAQQALHSLPIYSVSATSPDEMGIEVGPDGVNEWFPKPLDPVELINRLHGAQTTVA
ncbi:MAG: response regulator [Planctomycetaceae bacterium]|nr:response regulator [Planctomycetaceae bacterium]